MQVITSQKTTSKKDLKKDSTDLGLTSLPQENDGAYWLLTNESQLEGYIAHVRWMFEKNRCITATAKSGRKRTLIQNAALHVYCSELANKMNEGGFDMATFFKKDVSVPWTTLLVKETMWKPIQRLVLNKSSTTDASTSEYDKVYEVLNRHLATEHGLHIPWPVKK